MNAAQANGWRQVSAQRPLTDALVAVEQQVIADDVANQPGAPIDVALAEWVPGFLLGIAGVVVTGEVGIAVTQQWLQRH
ncbi:hypothetical protein D3C85_1859910 [compost metagenome]